MYFLRDRAWIAHVKFSAPALAMDALLTTQVNNARHDWTIETCELLIGHRPVVI